MFNVGMYISKENVGKVVDMIGSFTCEESYIRGD